MPRREDSAIAEGIADVVRTGRPVIRQVRAKPRFATGDRIVTRNLNPRGHTRLPRYARNKGGVIARHYGAHVFPDTNAHGLGENSQHLYSVRFSARELWDDTAEPNESILVDLWESYLEKESTPTQTSVQGTLSETEKASSETSSKSRRQTRKVSIRAVSKTRKKT